MQKKSLINWKLYLVLLIATTISVILLMPFSMESMSQLLSEVEVPNFLIVIVSVIQNTVMFGIVIFLGLILGKQTGLGAPVIDGLISRRKKIYSNRNLLAIPIISGILIGIVLVVCDYIFYKMDVLITFFNISQPIWWKGLLASFYGGIAEEVLMRLFIMNLFIWLFSKMLKEDDKKNNKPVIWISIIISAVIFGVGHLPATTLYTSLTPIIVLRALLLNGLGGIVFGWLFWKRGLLSAIIAHFSADIVLHVLLAVIIPLVGF